MREFAGLLLALLALVAFADNPGKAGFDEMIFLDVGASIARTGLPIRTYEVPAPAMFFDHAPLWPYLVGLLTALTPDPLFFGRALSFVAVLGSVACVYLLVLRHAGALLATVAALLLATAPIIGDYAYTLRMEPFMLLGICGALLALDRERWGWAGLALLLAVMSKEFALLFLAFATTYAWWRARWAALWIALPSVIAFGLWLGYAAWLDIDAFVGITRRWADAAAEGNGFGVRVIGPAVWSEMLVFVILGPMLAAASLLALARWRELPPIARLALVYGVAAVALSFAMALKEPRHLFAAPVGFAIAGVLALPLAFHRDDAKVVVGVVNRRAPEREGA